MNILNNLFKKTIAAFIAFIITFNLILFNYQRPVDVHADAITIGGSVVFSILAGVLAENLDDGADYVADDERNQMVKDYYEWQLEHYPEEFEQVYDQINNLPFNQQVGVLADQGISPTQFQDYVNKRKCIEDGEHSGYYWLSDASAIALNNLDIINHFPDWLLGKGMYAPETGTYNYVTEVTGEGEIVHTSQTNIGNLINDYYTNFCGRGTGWADWYFDNGSVVTIVISHFNNQDFFYLVYGDFPSCISGTYPTGFETSCSGVYIAKTNNKYNNNWVYTPYEIVAKIYIDTAGENSVSSGGTSVYGPDLKLKDTFFNDISKSVDDHNATYADDVTVHNSDGTTNVYENVTNVYYPVRAEESVDAETGETIITLVPLTADEIVSEGLSFDPTKVFEKPSETVITQPLVDTQTGEDVKVGAVTGAVSITNSQAIADAIAGDFVTGREGLDDFEIQRDLTTVFPFCLPFDIMRILDTFRADPVCPVIRFDFTQVYPFSLCPASYHDNLQFVLDFADYDVFIRIEKFAVIISYVLFLITKTRSALIRG